MKQIVLIIGIAVVLLAGFGCSRKAPQAENTNAATESPFAYITDANQALAEGNRLLDENQTDMAIEAYRQAIKLNPDLAEAHFKLGIAYALVEMAQQVDPDANTAGTDTNSDARIKPRSQKAFERAVEAYKKWIDANPGDDAAYFNLGRSYSKLNKDDEAEKALRQAVKIKPDDTEYQTELGSVLIRLAKYHEAIAPLKKAIELDATNSRAEDLLDDAEAGAKRLDYVMPKNTANSANSNANANANMAANSNSGSNSKPPEGNTRPPGNKPPHPGNKPN